MKTKTIVSLAAAASIAAITGSGAWAATRSAQASPAAKPAAAAPSQQQAQPDKPAAPAKPPCIAQKENFTNHKTFEIELTNSCEQRVRCVVRAYVVNSRGPTKGRRTLTLAPKSKGAASHKTYVIKLKENYGSANVSRSCKVL